MRDDSTPDPWHWWVQHYWRQLIQGWYWYRLKRGIRNIYRYAPIIWNDEDFNWEGLAELMAFKMEKMADVHKDGNHLHHKRDERQLRIAAHCCRRLVADEYFEKAGYDDKTFRERVDARGICKQAEYAARSDQRILGRLISRHLRSWWD